MPQAKHIRNMPAVLLRQFRIFCTGEQLVSVAILALVDDPVAKRIHAGDKRLTAVEWKSGANVRAPEVVARFGAEVEMGSNWRRWGLDEVTE